MLNTEFICDNLPEDWEIDIKCRRGELAIVLYDPHGNRISEVMGDGNEEETVDEGIERLVGDARISDGLSRVDLPLPEIHEDSYRKGYRDALANYATWKNGEQLVGAMQRPLKEVIASDEQHPVPVRY